MLNLVIKYGKRDWKKVDIYKLVSMMFDKSKSEVKRMFDQEGILITFQTDREYEKFKKTD